MVDVPTVDTRDELVVEALDEEAVIVALVAVLLLLLTELTAPEVLLPRVVSPFTTRTVVGGSLMETEPAPIARAIERRLAIN